MGKGLGKIQKKILEVLDELKTRDQKDWFSLRVVVIFLYTPWQIDRKHERNRDIIEFRKDWSYGKNEHRRIWESVRMLEKRGLVKVRIERVKGSGYATKWSGIQRWMEVRIV